MRQLSVELDPGLGTHFVYGGSASGKLAASACAKTKGPHEMKQRNAFDSGCELVHYSMESMTKQT